MTYLRYILALMFVVLSTIFSVQAQDIESLRDRAFNGDSNAMLELAKIYEKQGDNNKYIGWLKRAAQEGNEEAINLFEVAELKKIVDPIERFKRVYTLAENGQVSAMRYLAELYENGNGAVTKDNREAISWYKKIVTHDEKHSNIDIMMRLANLYEKENNVNEAISWYKKIISYNEKDSKIKAMKEIVNVYQKNNNMNEAILWTNKLKDEGEKEYFNGTVLIEMANRGDIWAMLYLGDIYKYETDKQNKLKWYKMAADKGDPEGKKKYKEIKQRYDNEISMMVQESNAKRRAQEGVGNEMHSYSALGGVWHLSTNRFKKIRITLYPSSGSVKFELWVGSSGNWIEYPDAHYVSPGKIYVNGGYDFGKVTFRLSGNSLVGSNGQTYYK